MVLMISNIAGPLIKVSITDGMRLILHNIGILSFFMAAILKPSKMEGEPKISSVNILILNQDGMSNEQYYNTPREPLGGAHGDAFRSMD